ncbi:MAG: pseudouridine synthase [Bacteroidota bacterium]
MQEEPSVSLNKFISSTGICSRRAADKMIEAGRVRINGAIAKKGNRVYEGDQVTLDGQQLKARPSPIYMVFNKPPGVTCTTDQRAPSNIIDFIGYPERIFPIGRLDKPSTGLLLLTNNGDIVNKILRVEHAHEKEYLVTVDRSITATFLRRMSSGVPILGTITKRCQVEKLADNRFRIILTQGLNRQIRRMCEFLGYKVVALKRVRIMHIKLAGLAAGKWRMLSPKELDTLLKALSPS